MPNACRIPNGSHSNALAICEIVAGHAVTVIIRAGIGTRGAGVSGTVAIRVVSIKGATEDVAAGKTRTKRRDYGAVLDWIHRLTRAPPNPIVALESEGISRSAAGKYIIVVVQIHRHSQAQLLVIIDATRPSCFGFCFGEGREQHGCENRNDCNDHEQFD